MNVLLNRDWGQIHLNEEGFAATALVSLKDESTWLGVSPFSIALKQRDPFLKIVKANKSVDRFLVITISRV